MRGGVIECDCGHRRPIVLQPLLVLTGASGTGKTTVANRLLGRPDLPVVLDADILWSPQMDTPDDGYAQLRSTWLHLAAVLAQAGRPHLLIGSGVPEQFDARPERAFVGAMPWCALVCDADELETRLRARPAWRGVTDSSIARMQQYDAHLRERVDMTVIDTTHASVDATVDQVVDWITRELDRDAMATPAVQAPGRGGRFAYLDDPVEVIAPDPAWPDAFTEVAGRLEAALGGLALRIDHIGSTAVPGLPAKDVIDVQVLVTSLQATQPIIDALATIGFTPRAGAWNQRDEPPRGWTGDARAWDKLTFAPPPEARPSNVHVRVAGSPNARCALLFRDFLRHDPGARDVWGELKAAVAGTGASLAQYGQVKTPATALLLVQAERWAQDTGWQPPPA